MYALLHFIWLAYACDTKDVKCTTDNGYMYVCYTQTPWPFLIQDWTYEGVTIEVVNLGKCKEA